MEILDTNLNKRSDAIVETDLRARIKSYATLLSNLANETRLQTVYLLASRGEMNVGELVAEIGLSQSALSQHLAKLREAGIITTRREAQKIYYSTRHSGTRELLAALDGIYDRRA